MKFVFLRKFLYRTQQKSRKFQRNLRKQLSWQSTTLPRLGSRVRVPFSAHRLKKSGNSRFFCIKVNIFCLPPGWWNGRHEGLKILWPLRLCGFKSRSGYRKRPIEFQSVAFFVLDRNIFNVSYSLQLLQLLQFIQLLQFLQSLQLLQLLQFLQLL